MEKTERQENHRKHGRRMHMFITSSSINSINRIKQVSILLSFLCLTLLQACDKEEGTGQITFWSNNPDQQQISVTIDGVPAGSITLFYQSAPSCGAMGCVTANLSPGSHSYYAADGYRYWNGTVTITEDECHRYCLKFE